MTSRDAMASDATQKHSASQVFSDLPPVLGLREVHSAHVRLREGFWGPRQSTHNEVTVHHALNFLEERGHVTNFDKAAGVFDGDLQGHAAFDSDLHKTLEGAMFCLQNGAGEALQQRVEAILDRVLAAQEADGFLIAYWMIKDQDQRWDDLRKMHQMYNAGHFFEMAVEHYRFSGNARVLHAAQRFADHIDRLFGPGKRYDVDGHQGVELALVKLYRATGERRYLELSRFFLDERGHAHGDARLPFDPASQVEPEKPEGELEGEQRREFWHAQLAIRNGRMQDHKPVVDQHEVIGHAVRATYMYAGMVDMVRFMQAPDYANALDHLWEDIVTRKLYITGGIGSGQYGDEGFGDPYLLPNEWAYCESCAAIAHVLFQHRMALLKGDTRYVDVMELTMYNGMLSGIAISGDQFFYENHLYSAEGATRREWIGIACCPTNLARIIPQVGGLAYAQDADRIVVNLYLAGEASMQLDDGVRVVIEQQTDYPWSGQIHMTVSPSEASTFTLCLRLPGWAKNQPVPGDLYHVDETPVPSLALLINGEATEVIAQEDGYLHLERRWQEGDVVELDLPMPVRRVYAHPNVADDQGKVVLMRGPVVYCLEGNDNPGLDLVAVSVPRDTAFAAAFRPDLLGGVTALAGEAVDSDGTTVTVTAIPSYALANREQSPMVIWMNEE